MLSTVFLYPDSTIAVQLELCFPPHWLSPTPLLLCILLHLLLWLKLRQPLSLVLPSLTPTSILVLPVFLFLFPSNLLHLLWCSSSLLILSSSLLYFFILSCNWSSMVNMDVVTSALAACEELSSNVLSDSLPDSLLSSITPPSLTPLKLCGRWFWLVLLGILKFSPNQRDPTPIAKTPQAWVQWVAAAIVW